MGEWIGYLSYLKEGLLCCAIPKTKRVSGMVASADCALMARYVVLSLTYATYFRTLRMRRYTKMFQSSVSLLNLIGKQVGRGKCSFPWPM